MVRISTSLPHGGIWPKSMSGCGIMYSIPMRKSLPIRTCIRWQVTPYIGGDVDGIIKMPDGHYALLEIKTTSFFNREAWANNAIPVPYEIQLRHYMAIMGLWRQLSYVWLTAIHSMFVIWFVTSMQNTRS